MSIYIFKVYSESVNKWVDIGGHIKAYSPEEALQKAREYVDKHGMRERFKFSDYQIIEILKSGNKQLRIQDLF